uniref:Importin N-terminal domain-containing protein n=1 Tax=Rhabditophanes sp. KR3021 TaxID=114890 RepID=A0AC35THU4_9BILA
MTVLNSKQQAMGTTATMEKLQAAYSELRGCEKFNVATLEEVVNVMIHGTGQLQKTAMEVLNDIKADESAWGKVDIILSKGQLPEAKHFALGLLEDMVSTKWKTLPREQCDGIKSFIISLILDICNDPNFDKGASRVFLQKLNCVLVQVVKQEWPVHWPNFIQEIVNSSRGNENLCANNLYVLRLLSEELFEFGGDLTTQKAAHLKVQFCDQFEGVFNLCFDILKTSGTVSLISSTLVTLNRFLQWIPIGYIFETQIINVIIEKFLPHPAFRSVSMNCLAEIASINVVGKGLEYENMVRSMLIGTMLVMTEQVPLSLDFPTSYKMGKEEDQAFIGNFTRFLTNFLREHHKMVLIINETNDTRSLKEAHMCALSYLLKISEIDEVEIFKVCLDYWTELCTELFRESPFSSNGGESQLRLYSFENNISSPKRVYYGKIIGELRNLMISKMAKPEEVIVVLNENNEPVRESVKDTDAIALYKTMKETLVYMCHLDPTDTERQMTEKLQKQVDGSEWSWSNLSRLCWAIGSISGAMHEDDERRFLVTVIRDLLALCEQKRGKDNKAVIASNIMYVVGQYPRFLRAFWRFLKTVINKLFEFMHESHDGVQDMACDTFIKIVYKTKKHFTTVQNNETVPFIDEIIQNLSGVICDLNRSQIHVFYEALGVIVSTVTDEDVQRKYISDMFNLPNAMWSEIIQNMNANPKYVSDAQILDNVINILKTYVASCKSIGHAFIYLLEERLADMMGMYYSISATLRQGALDMGESITSQPGYKNMKAVRKEILTLISAWVSKSQDTQIVKEKFMSVIYSNVLEDYRDSQPFLREPKVLTLMGIISTHLGTSMAEFVNGTFDCLFMPTLNMINTDLIAYPEHRVNFYKFLYAITCSCPKAIVGIPQNQMDVVLQAVIWGAQHQVREVAETAIELLNEIFDAALLLEMPAKKDFFVGHYIVVMESVLGLVCDRNQVQFIGLSKLSFFTCKLFSIPEFELKFSLDPANPTGSNVDYIYGIVNNIFAMYIKTLSAQQIEVTVKGFFSYNQTENKMREHIRDFLIQMKNECGEDTADLFLEERKREIENLQANKKKIPGLVNPNDDVADDDMY